MAISFTQGKDYDGTSINSFIYSNGLENIGGKLT